MYPTGEEHHRASQSPNTVPAARRRQSPLELPQPAVQGVSKRRQQQQQQYQRHRHSCSSATSTAQQHNSNDCNASCSTSLSPGAQQQTSKSQLSSPHRQQLAATTPTTNTASAAAAAGCPTYTICHSASNAPPAMLHRYQSSMSPRHSPQAQSRSYQQQQQQSHGAAGADSEQNLVLYTGVCQQQRMCESLSSSTSSSAGSAGGANMLTDVAQHYTQMCAQFEQMYASGTLCDVVLRTAAAAGPSAGPMPGIACHRVVLAAASAYFAAMFTAGMQETHQPTVTIHEIEHAALQQLVNFCYTGGVHLDETNVEHVLSGACLLQLEPVVDLCTQFLTNQLHQSNCLGIRNFADRLGSCPKLRKVADNYAKEHFEQVMESHEFVDLPLEQVEALIRSDELNVNCELAVLYALCRWISRSPRTRAASAGRLLMSVRLIHLTAEQISDHIEGNPLFSAAPCQKQALKYHLMPNRRSELLNHSASTSSGLHTSAAATLTPVRPRPSTVGTVFAIGGSDANRTAQSIEQYDNRSDAWHVVSRLPSRRLQFGSAVNANRVYIAGGRDGLKTLSSFECWNTSTNEWTAMPAMMTPRHGLSVAFLSGPLYACGGHDGWAYLSSVERWDPDTQTWSYVAEMNRARASAGVAVIGTSLYCAGGRDSSQVLRCVECYNPHTNKWTLVASMNRRRSGVGVATLDGCLYAVGGIDAPSSNPQSASYASVERYDPRVNEWTMVASLSLGRDGIGVCTVGDRLMAVGGCQNSVCVNLVECYSAETNTWTEVCPLQTGRAGTQVVLVPNRCPNYSIAHLPLVPANSLTAEHVDDDENENDIDRRTTANRSDAAGSGATVVKPAILPKPTAQSGRSVGPSEQPDQVQSGTVQSGKGKVLVVRCQSPVDDEKQSYSI